MKSATDKNGAFSPDDANIYRQMAGESAEERLARDEAAWKRQLDGFMETAEQHSMRSYRIMETPLVFSLLNPQGFHVQLGKDIAISHAMLWKVLREKEMKGKSHGHALDMTPEIMKRLPRALANPIMILRNRKGDDPNAPILPDEIVAVVDLQDKNGSTAIVPIILKERNGKYMMKTFFGKDDPTWFQKRMMLGDVLYAHKKRALDWVKAIQRHKAPGRFTLQDSFFNSISTDADLVKAREENQSFYQSAWHGSPHDFVEFLLSAIGTGEGAQVHGWGLYFAKERSVSEWYKKMLGDRAELSIWYDGKRWEEIPSEIQEAINEALKFNNAPYIKKHYAENMASFEAAIHEGRNTVARYDELIRFVEQNPNAETSELWGKVKGTTDTIEEAFGRDLFTEGSNHEALFEALKEEKNKHESYLRDDERSYMLLKRLDPEKIEINKSGKLFKVEIPDNDVLLDEQKPFDEQPKFVQEKLEEMFSRADTEQLLYALSKKDPRFDEVYSDYCELLDHEQDEAYAQEIRQRYNHELSRLLGSNTIPQALLRSFASGQEIYKSISDVFSQLRGDKEASLALNEVGIKGITYEGWRDGRCFVIFDDKTISIIEKFNQMLRQEVRGEISKEDGKRIITLFESADESTFMHEMGHMFLMDLDELAKMDEASAKDLETVNAWAEWHEGAAEEYEDTPWAEEFRAHEEAIRKAVAAGDVIAEKAARERWRQERFARGVELFLTEGKAPSHALRGVFRKFKEYLRKIYHFVRSVGGHPSPEVQAVMALMIATEDEIKAASLDALYRPMEGLGGKEGIKTLLGETEAETYGRWLKEAQEEAKDILRARVMKDLKKEARAEVRERLDAERERKRAELENDPVHLAAAAIQAAGSEDVALNWFPSLEAYKKAHAERKPLETELAEHMEDYAKKIDTEIMTSHLTEESIVRAMQTPKAYHRRIAIEMAALRRRERMMQKVGGKEQDVHADAVAVRGDEFGAYKHIKELRDRAIAYYRNVLQGTSVENVHLGKVDIDENGLVEFTGSGRREAKSTSAKPEKLLLIKYLPKLIRGATNITENAAQKESHAGEYFYYLHTNASVDGTTVPVVITLIKRNDGSIQYYNHTLPSLEESIKKEPPVSAGPVSSNEALGTPPVGDSVVSTIPQRNMVGQVSASGVRRASPEEIRKEYERAAEENVRVLREEAAWNALVDRYDAADKKKWKAQKDGKLFHVMDVPLVMQLLNIPYDSLHVFGSFFAHSVNPKHKGMTLDILRQLPRKMADPLMIIRGNDAGSYVFVVELKDTNGATVVAPVEIGKDIKSTGGIVNVINSAFGKTAGKKGDKPSLKWFDKQFKANNVLYINKNKSIAWLQPYRNGSPAVATISNALSKFIVSGVGQNVKTEVDLDAAKKANPGFYQMSYGEKMALGKFNHRVVDIQFVEVDEKQALKSNFIGIRYDDNVYQVGDELENSHDWPEGNWTETELNGACAVDVMSPGGDYQDLDEFKKHAIEQLNDSNEYLNENVYLISGTSYEYGNDPNEVILSNPEVIGILKLVRWDELSEEEQERYRKQQEVPDEKEEEADEVSTEQNTGVQFTYDGKDAGDLSADVFEGIELLDGWNGVHDTESLREKYDDLLAHAERTVERDKKHLANVNKAISILESAPNTTKEEFEKEFGPDSNIMMTIKYPSSDGLAADLAYEKEGVQKSINMDQHRVDVLKRIDPNKLQWKKQKTETFNQSAWHGSPYDLREFLLEMIGAGAGAQAHGWGYLAQNKDLPEEYRRQLTAFVYEPGWTEEQMSAARLYSERDMAKAVIAQNTESPAEGWRSLYNDFTAARDEILQPAIDALSKGMKQGVDILPLGEDGRGIRVSNNAPWYQEYYKEHGKAPNQAQLRDLAYLLTVGDASAPNVEGWIPTTREAAEAMDAARGELDELNGHIQTLENIKERMMKVDSFEVKGSAGLSPEGYKLYRQIMEMLEKIGGEQKEDKQTKAARMNAMLFAHHADIFAAAMRTQEGKEKYTALDYFKDRFALRYGGTDMRQNGLYQSATDVPSAEKEAVRKQYAGTALWMKAPNGKATNLTEDQWLTVRTPAFKAWFGDWEAEAEKQKYLHTDPIEVAEKKIMKSEGVTAMRAALQWAEQHLPVQVMTRFGEVEINRASIKDSLGHGYSQKKLDAITSLPEGMMVAAFIGETKDFDGADIDNGYFCYPMMYQGENQVVFCRVRRDMNSNKLYVHEVFTEDEIKDIPLQAAAKFLNSKPHGGNALYKSILTDFLNKDNTVSKVVDENGEPLVVYHQTSNMFDSFDVRHEGAGRNDSETPYGIFLKPNADDIGFGDIQMPLFARVCNPLRFNNREQLAHWAKKEVEGYADLAERLQSLDAVYKKRSDVAEQQENKLYEEMWNAQERGELSDEEYEAKAAELEEHGEWERILKEWQETTAAVRHDMKELLDAVVRSSGYDGFLLDTDAGAFGRKVPTIVALTPWQVKSATDNNGAFLADDANIYHQSAWHGSPHDFVEFLLSAIGTGEGAQAHGWGLYFAKAKKTAASYRGRLSSKNELEIVYDGKKSEELTGDIKAAIQLLHLQGFRPEDNLGKFIKTRVKDYTEMIRRWENRIREIDNTLSTNAAQAAQAQLYEERKDNVDRVATSKNVVRQLKLIDPKKAVIKGAGSLFHVEIPDNDVLLDEDKSYTKQPLKVREALEKLVRGLTLDQLENWNDVRRLGKSKVIAEIMDALSESNGMNIYGTISDLAEGQKEASVLLNQYGIKGITYGGQEDGRCFVIFDDKAISIIEKFNQMLRQEVRGEISKEDGKRIITLFESADESTFMHEMGHMFLMDLDELAKMDEASAKELETVNAWAEWHEGAAEDYKDTDFADEFRDHENAILAAKKSGDVVAEKAALERWRQERFARGFEMYLSEGKAPSAAMRSVFRRFKAFLRKIYNLAKNAGAMPSVEVQAVMARMIATENEITEAKLDERFRPIEKLLGKESVESLLGETEAELYKRWTQEAQEEAEDILRKRVMNDLKKEVREEFNQKVEAERERKRAELENDPVYLAEYTMRQGGSTDVVMNWFPSYAAYKKARGKRKTLENELKDYMTEYARKLDEQIMQEHLSDENVARAMQTPKAYHRRLAIESAALRRKERLMRLLGGNAPEEVKKKAVAEAKKAESPTRRGTKQEVRKDIRRLHQMHGYP